MTGPRDPAAGAAGGGDGAPEGAGVPGGGKKRAAPRAEEARRADSVPFTSLERSILLSGGGGQPTSAVAFVQWWLANIGRVVLTHIHPEERDIRARARAESRDLTAEEQALVAVEYGNSRSYPRYYAEQTPGAAWLALNAAGRNTYFAAACSRELAKGEGRNKKLRKDAIAYSRVVWADIDPPADCADLAAWRAAQVAALEGHAQVPPPSIVIHSGNGVQPLWLLRERFAIDGQRERCEEFERTTGALVDLLGADASTWNADRILRVPYTTNWPDSRKRAKGRVPTEAGILLWRPDREYDIADLPRLDAHPQAKTRPAAKGARAASAPAPAGDLLRHLAGKQYADHHQAALAELGTWAPDLTGDGTLLTDEQYARLSDRARDLLLHGAPWRDCVVAYGSPNGQCGDVDYGGMAPRAEVLREGADGSRHWAKHDRNGQCLSFAAVALGEGLAPSLVAGLLVQPHYGISAHCRDQSDPVRAAVRCVGEAIAQTPAPEGDVVELRPGYLHATLIALQDALVRRQVPLYQRAGALVMPIRLDHDSADAADVRRRRGAILLHRPNAAGLVSILAGACRFVRQRGPHLVPADPTTELAHVFLAGRERWRMPALDGLTGVPVWRPDGSVLTVAGYDAATRLFYDPAGMTFPALPDAPTREDALAALAVLRRPFRAFPIPRPECQAALLAALLAVVVAPTVDAVPAIGVSASLPGFGKTMLQRCIGALAMGADPASMNQSASDEEDAKRLDAVLLAGDPIIAIDNVTRPVGGDVLCSIVTNGVHKVRVLGRSEVPQVSARVQVVVNGNHLAFWGDMCRRVLLVVIEDDATEKPETRDFDFDPVSETLAARGVMVAAALTVLRAWHCAGRPRPAAHLPMGSFAGWEPVRLALLWLGCADPRASQALVAEDDPQREVDADLLAALWRCRQGGVFRAADLRGATHDERGQALPLGDALLDGGPWNARRAGNRLRLLRDRWIGDIRLRRVREDAHGQQYRLERRGGDPAAGAELREEPF